MVVSRLHRYPRRRWSWLLHPDATAVDRGQEPPRLPRSAVEALARTGLGSDSWRERLASNGLLREFVARYYTTPGFHHVVRHYYRAVEASQVARLAVHWANRRPLRTSARQRLRFELVWEPAATGPPARVVQAFDRGNGMHYSFLPWRRIPRAVLLRRVLRDRALHGGLAARRYVLPRRASELRAELKRLKRLSPRVASEVKLQIA